MNNLVWTEVRLFSPPFATFFVLWLKRWASEQSSFYHHDRSPPFLFYCFFFSANILFVCPASVVCSVCFGLLYDRGSDFISCNKYFNIMARVTAGFFRRFCVFCGTRLRRKAKNPESYLRFPFGPVFCNGEAKVAALYVHCDHKNYYY